MITVSAEWASADESQTQRGDLPHVLLLRLYYGYSRPELSCNQVAQSRAIGLHKSAYLSLNPSVSAPAAPSKTRCRSKMNHVRDYTRTKGEDQAKSLCGLLRGRTRQSAARIPGAPRRGGRGAARYVGIIVGSLVLAVADRAISMDALSGSGLRAEQHACRG